MASDAPVEKSGSHSQRAAFAAIHTLRHKALEKLTLAIAKAVESASDDTLADIVGSEDLRHALVIASSEEHTSELQSLMRISYAVFCLKKKKTHIRLIQPEHPATTTN